MTARSLKVVLACSALTSHAAFAVPTTVILDIQPGESIQLCKALDAGTQVCRTISAGAAPIAPAAAIPSKAAAPIANPTTSEPEIAQPKAAAAAVASSPEKPASATKPDAFGQLSSYAEVDLSVPSSPAFAVLGISPDSVQRPGTLRDFAASVVRGLGPDGKPTNGIAIDISPVSVFAKELIRGGETYAPEPMNDLSEGWYKRVLARTTISFGTTSADSNGATRSAVGLRTGLLDWGDPGLYWAQTAKCVATLDHPAVGPGKVLDSKPFDLSECDPAESTAYSLWAKPALYMGYGQSWYSQTGALTDRAPDAKQFWMTFSQGLTAQSLPNSSRPAYKNQLASSLRVLGQLYFGRRLNDRTPDPNNASALLKEDSTQAIARLRVGMATWHTFVEFGRSRVTLGNETTENLRHRAAGAEVKLGGLFGDDSWLQLASVNDRGFADGKDHSGVTLNFKIGSAAMPLPGPAAATSANK
jgi:hypothetical protein